MERGLRLRSGAWRAVVPLAGVEAVAPAPALRRVPGVGSPVLGAARLGGGAVAVVGLSELMGGAPAPVGRIVQLRRPAGPLALAVEAVESLGAAEAEPEWEAPLRRLEQAWQGARERGPAARPAGATPAAIGPADPAGLDVALASLRLQDRWFALPLAAIEGVGEAQAGERGAEVEAALGLPPRPPPATPRRAVTLRAEALSLAFAVDEVGGVLRPVDGALDPASPHLGAGLSGVFRRPGGALMGVVDAERLLQRLGEAARDPPPGPACTAPAGEAVLVLPGRECLYAAPLAAVAGVRRRPRARRAPAAEAPRVLAGAGEVAPVLALGRGEDGAGWAAGLRFASGLLWLQVDVAPRTGWLVPAEEPAEGAGLVRSARLTTGEAVARLDTAARPTLADLAAVLEARAP